MRTRTIASAELVIKLNDLVRAAGSDREAESLIKRHVGYAPSHSAIYKSRTKGAGTDYTVSCYIRDIENALKEKE